MSETSSTPHNPDEAGEGQQSSRPFYRRPVVIALSITAAAALIAGGCLINVLNNHPKDHPAAATSSTPIVSITNPTSTAPAKPSTSAKPTTTAKPKPSTSKPATGANNTNTGSTGSGGGDTTGTGSAPIAGGAPINGSNGAVGTGNTGGGTGITPQNPAPAPAPVKPKPIIVPPPVVEQPPAPPVRENPYQSLGSINAHRIASGVPGFIAPSAACRPMATVTGTALDSYQHQNVVLAVYGKTAAAFSKGADYDTLTVYQC